MVAGLINVTISQHADRFDGVKWVDIYNRRFTELFNGSIMSWKIEEESLFDQNMGSF